MLSLPQIKSILNDTNPETTEKLAQKAKTLTQQFFGRTISLYTPLYLSNYCSSHCTYCGFSSHNRIRRMKLTTDQMKKEMSYLAKSGIENILLLTGESKKITPLPYLQEAVNIAKNHFSSICLEVHPMDEQEYRELFFNGVDGITIYQETYDRKKYQEVHLAGEKRNYDYRFKTPERIAKAGIRQLSMGILLGLHDVSEDLFSLYEHLRFMEKHFAGIEYSVSFPRLRKIKGQKLATCHVDDITFIKIICLTRILFPRVGINLSTREEPTLRDNAIELGITRISAGSNTSVGGYTVDDPERQEPQFDIEDTRPTNEIISMLKKRSFDPVLTDWRRIKNESL